MELWIRSQDGESIIKVEKLELIYDCLCSDEPRLFHIDSDKQRLASYSTKERALEILNEIHQRLIDLQTLEITPDFYKVCKRNLDNVYEMPKK